MRNHTTQGGSPLTRAELDVACRAEIDLAVGYPQMEAPNWLTELWYGNSLRTLAERFLETHPHISARSGSKFPPQEALIEATLRAVCSFLDLPTELAEQGCLTYSGSHALERVISTCLAGRPSTFAVSTDPCIDIIPAMISECNVSIRYVSAPTLDSCPAVHELIDATDSARTPCSLLAISSPENPTGAVYSAEDLEQLGDALAEKDIPLLVDQSFLKIAPFGAVPCFLAAASDQGRWAFMWDTGKTLEMADDKLGFIFASSTFLPDIKRRLEVLQYSVPSHKLMLCTLALEAATDHRFGETVSRLVEQNIRTFRTAFADTRAKALQPRAGGFALLDVSEICGAGSVAELVAGLLQETGVGVIAADRFFHSQRPPAALLRVAMTRDAAITREGVGRMRSYLDAYART